MKNLYNFIIRAAKATYATGGKREKTPQRLGFTELVYRENKYLYRDSWTGFYRSRGMELVRYQNKPVWSSLYGGGMIKGKEDLAQNCFDFLKIAFLKKDTSIQSFRGPKLLDDGDWRYTYQQEGDIKEFSGYEEIYFKDKLVFFHRIIGGLIIHKK